MPGFPWFPFGFKPIDDPVGRLIVQGKGYQVVQVHDDADRVSLILVEQSFICNALTSAQRSEFRTFVFDGKNYLARTLPLRDMPSAVSQLPARLGLPTAFDARVLGRAIRDLRTRESNYCVGTSLFLPSTGECLAVEEVSGEDLPALAMRLLTGSAKTDAQDVGSIREINSWLLPAEISEFLAVFGVEAKPQTLINSSIVASTFSLPGRPALEKFFREYILEPSAERERYEALGVKVPNILLHGPTGSGKSFAVSKLVKALGWPVFEVDLATVGSSFIHQTSISLRNTFEQAKNKAPAVVVLEEIDSLALSRGPMMHDHKVEEITELLRSVEKATENRILVIATTNRLEALDSAIRRKGRFDHEIEVGYPTAVEVRSAIEAMLEPRPHDDIQCLEPLSAALAGRPMSDVAWLVNEAARLAARAGKRSIGDADLMAAASGIGRWTETTC